MLWPSKKQKYNLLYFIIFLKYIEKLHQQPQTLILIPVMQTNALHTYLKELRHGWRILKKLATFFKFAVCNPS